MINNPQRLFVAICLALLVSAGCATKSPAPVVERVRSDLARPTGPIASPATDAVKQSEGVARTHIVNKGETLISIALQFGLDYKDLADWNQLGNANVIQVGQELKVSAPAQPSIVATPLAAPGAPIATPLLPGSSAPIGIAPEGKPTTARMKTEPKAVKLPFSDKALAELEAEARVQTGSVAPLPAVAPVPPANALPVNAKVDDEKLEWGWPSRGKLLAGYSESSKGIDIAGTKGAPVLAAASGKVMYSGTGIRGYGKLVIIKHNNTFLSAYAHNDNVLVKEGQDVKLGERIADMGSSDTDQVKLHFEIRRQGKPIDPSRLLPSS